MAEASSWAFLTASSFDRTPSFLVCFLVTGSSSLTMYSTAALCGRWPAAEVVP
ncbi:MAG: hypothetical protein ACREPI_08980 [Candidatus Dormibacterales bacterium]